jgi:diacylglycerol kinase family enzyme
VRLLLIVNSFASSVTARNRVVIEQILGEHHEIEVRETNRRGHATRFAQDAASKGVDVVVALGGDGTLNEVANGLARTDTALATLPGGSTNVFARTIGLANDPVAAAREIAVALDAGRIQRVGLGSVNGRFFCFHTGIGFDAAVVRAVERHASVKRWLGHPLFIWAGLTTYARGYSRASPHFRVSFPDGSVVDDGYFTIVMNTNPYTYLGNRPLDLSPAATLDRPLVAITFRSLGLVTLLGGLGRAVLGGGIKAGTTSGRGRIGRIHQAVDLTGLTVESDAPFPYQVDGDYLGETRRLVFADEPDALRLVIPAVVPDRPV